MKRKISIALILIVMISGLFSFVSVAAPGSAKAIVNKPGIKPVLLCNAKKGNVKNNWKANQKGPVSYTVIKPEDIKNDKKLAAWYEKNYTKKGIHYIRKGKTVYVLVSAGEKPTGGYQVAIKSVEMEGKRVANVSAVVTGPSSDTLVTQAITYPHLLIKLGNNKIKRVKGTITEVVNNTGRRPVPYQVLTQEEVRKDKAIYDWYQSIYKTKGIYYRKSGDNVYIAVNAGEKRTGGYSMKIDEVVLINGTRIFVSASVISPPPGSVVTTAITYPSLIMRVKAEGIVGVTGEIKDDGAVKTFGDVAGKYTAKDVQSMELRDLQGKKIRDFSATERERILNELNMSTIDDSPYILMLAGNSIYMKMTNGTIINLWSYGSETNFIAVVNSGGKSQSYHLVGPAIARILFQKK